MVFGSARGNDWFPLGEQVTIEFSVESLYDKETSIRPFLAVKTLSAVMHIETWVIM